MDKVTWNDEGKFAKCSIGESHGNGFTAQHLERRQNRVKCWKYRSLDEIL